jgi:hypothetical protein
MIGRALMLGGGGLLWGNGEGGLECKMEEEEGLRFWLRNFQKNGEVKKKFKNEFEKKRIFERKFPGQSVVLH